MEALPEEGTDKLHAMDRARDVAKKMNDSTRAVQKGGKPLLDSNSRQHLKDLLDDAVNKGEMSQEEIDGIAEEANSMGDKFLDEEHQESIADDNARQRAHHEEFLDHAEGTSEEALQRKGHDLDHSKAHELHHYETNEDGTVGKRTGSSHSTRNEDGSVKHMDASGEGGVPGSEDDAVEGMESQHPPKLLGLDEDGKAAQKEHFDLMKKGAAVPLSDEEMSRFKELEGMNSDLADPKYKGQLLGAQRHQISGEGGGDKMSAMGIDGKDQDEAAESSCRPPTGAMPTGVGKAWNPDTHRWCDKEYLDELKGQLGPGEASYHPDGVHAGTDNAHLDQDADGNVQAAMVTQTGVHKVNPSSGEMKTADGGAVSQADVLGHHLKDHAGGKVDKNTLQAMGMNHSEKHTGEGQKGGGLKQAFQETPGMQMTKPILGKLGRMMQRNKKSEEGKPNATATDRQRARRDTEGSPSSSFLNKLGKYTKEGLRDAAEELPEYAGGGLLRGGQKIPLTDKTVGGTDRWQDKQVRQAADRVAKRQSAADKLTERINRVTGENE
jgi:polyhydroxyalkanoate synthesis regulator phasin